MHLCWLHLYRNLTNMIKVGELSDILRQSGIRADLEEASLLEILSGVFRIDLDILPVANPKMLLAQVKLAPDTRHIDDFVAKYSLNDKRERLLDMRKYILENCEELTFESSYMATFRGATRSIVVYDYHEFENQGIDATERRKDIINLLIPGFFVGFSAGVIATYIPTFPAISSNIIYNMGTQGLIWGGIATGGLYVADILVKSISKSSRTESKRERKDGLGYETVINDQISLEALEESLGRNYDEFKPPRVSHFSEFDDTEGRYSGKTVIYKLESEKSYGRFRRRSKSTLSLSRRLQNNPNSPLFGIILADTKPSNIIGSVMLNIKIGGERIKLHKIKSFRYDSFELDPRKEIKEYKSAIYLLS